MQMLVVERKVLMWTLVVVRRKMLVVVRRKMLVILTMKMTMIRMSGLQISLYEAGSWSWIWNRCYHSEELKNPISSDDEDEDVDKVYSQYNESSQVGGEKLELGMEFGTLTEFKSSLREYSIFMDREFKWKKNDK